MIFQAELGQPMKSEGQVYNVTLPVISAASSSATSTCG
jgi:hypothetical protein